MISIRPLLRSTTRSFYTWNTPKNTPRVTLDDGSVLISRQPLPISATASTSASAQTIALPPRLRSYPKRSPMSPEQEAECRKLRAENPDVWTVQTLCRKYNTYPGRILELTAADARNSSRNQMLAKQEQARFENLPISKKVTIVDRIRRKALW
ncbi:hypothetical protein BCR33DRAFT_722273 [Rhizoclosmatium globosum]|uniref:Uncharacterized protein n=1 Tax=Rhizoclosmatium globosum TaxID=329046 RepID=A0A1Y2BN86_9FUNG|nr:hypothetical protein BCR33DRAFT_722273 [Rhizoclosmatium globosum]|eukprot:ORY36172.1 hypothetical protein BCR33DRAFT_722273 [Rhizoclosmatium globosum]